MPFVKIWIHAVWAVKNREKILLKSTRGKLFDHIHKNALQKGIFMDCVNGYQDHVHCLYRLTNDQTVKRVMQLIKGESSYWAGQKNIISPKLAWQDDYFAVSVGESQVATVRKYIQNQEKHHQTKTFAEEYDEFIEKYGFQVFQD